MGNVKEFCKANTTFLDEGYLSHSAASFSIGDITISDSEDIVFFPDSESSDKDMSLFLVRKSEEGTVCLIEDNHLLSTDEKHPNYRAAMKVGDRTIECSKMYYDMRPVQYSRFLTLVFPTDGVDLKNFDIIFYKKNNPEKIKQAIKNVALD